MTLLERDREKIKEVTALISSFLISFKICKSSKCLILRAFTYLWFNINKVARVYMLEVYLLCKKYKTGYNYNAK